MRISNSFSEGEIQVLEFILQTLLRGGTPSMATRNKDFAKRNRRRRFLPPSAPSQRPTTTTIFTAKPADRVDWFGSVT
jgi:hypothetical protein